MNILTATYQQKTIVLSPAFRRVDPGADKDTGKINDVFFQRLDYYPYGMEMPGRTFTAQSYHYGYQGSEQAPEYSQAGGNMYTTFFRTLDSRLGRWSTPDVVSQPWQSPYCSMDNNPVALVDPWGAESGSEPGFESGRGTNENPIQIEEITVTASRSGGTSSAPSRTKIYVNTFDPGDLVMNQIRKSQAQEDYEATLTYQRDNTNVEMHSFEDLSRRMTEKGDPLQGDYEDSQKSGDYFYTEDGPAFNKTYADNIDKETDLSLLLLAIDKKVEPEIPSSTKNTKNALSIFNKIIQLLTEEQPGVEVKDNDEVDGKPDELGEEIHGEQKVRVIYNWIKSDTHYYEKGSKIYMKTDPGYPDSIEIKEDTEFDIDSSRSGNYFWNKNDK